MFKYSISFCLMKAVGLLENYCRSKVVTGNTSPVDISTLAYFALQIYRNRSYYYYLKRQASNRLASSYCYFLDFGGIISYIIMNFVYSKIIIKDNKL